MLAAHLIPGSAQGGDLHCAQTLLVEDVTTLLQSAKFCQIFALPLSGAGRLASPPTTSSGCLRSTRGCGPSTPAWWTRSRCRWWPPPPPARPLPAPELLSRWLQDLAALLLVPIAHRVANPLALYPAGSSASVRPQPLSLVALPATCNTNACARLARGKGHFGNLIAFSCWTRALMFLFVSASTRQSRGSTRVAEQSCPIVRRCSVSALLDECSPGWRRFLTNAAVSVFHFLNTVCRWSIWRCWSQNGTVALGGSSGGSGGGGTGGAAGSDSVAVNGSLIVRGTGHS